MNDFIAEALNSNKTDELGTVICKTVYACGIPPMIRGYQYINEAVRIIIDDIDCLNRLADTVYPRIAENFLTTPSRVSKAIKHAIEISLSFNGEKSLRNHFSNGNPSNEEFLSLLVDQILQGIISTQQVPT